MPKQSMDHQRNKKGIFFFKYPETNENKNTGSKVYATKQK